MKRALWLLTALSALPVLLLGCKDEDPCDPGQEIRGPGCYPVPKSDAGSPSTAGGEAGSSDGGGAPSSNSDATFGTECQANDQCGNDAPVCATEVLFYCTQIDCQDGEANAGACPEGWSCIKSGDKPSACVNLSAL